MQRLFAADLAILDYVFQPFSDWWRDLTGKSNFWWVRICCWLALAALTWACIMWNGVSHFSVRLIPALLLLILIGAPLFRTINMLEKNQSRLEEKWELARTLNPLRFQLASLRLRGWMCIVGLVLMSIVAKTTEGGPLFIRLSITMLIIVIAIYFLSCTPKPRAPYRQQLRTA